MTSVLSFSDTEALATVSPLRTKIALPYWSCNLSVMRVIPCILGRLRDGPRWVSWRQRMSQLFRVYSSATRSCLAHVRPSMLDETIVRAGPDKDPCWWPRASSTDWYLVAMVARRSRRNTGCRRRHCSIAKLGEHWSTVTWWYWLVVW